MSTLAHPTTLDAYTGQESLTVEQTAAVLGSGRDATYAAVRAGRIRAYQIGRRLRVPKAEVRRLLMLDPSETTSPR